MDFTLLVNGNDNTEKIKTISYNLLDRIRLYYLGNLGETFDFYTSKTQDQAESLDQIPDPEDCPNAIGITSLNSR